MINCFDTPAPVQTFTWKIPATWRFHQYAKHGTRLWKICIGYLPGSHPDAMNPYDARREAVKLRRAYTTEGRYIPLWLHELTK